MQLPFIKKNESEKSFFLSLLIKPYKVATILFEEVENKLFILATNETSIESDIDQISSDELLAAADKTISTVETSLPEGASVEKTIFSLPYDWVEENKIKSTYLDRLKNMCKALDLTPIGYLTSIEAIVHFMDKNEGAPVSAIFIEITKGRVFAYLVKAGRIIEAHSETISATTLEASELLLKRFQSVDVIPAKIILLDLENSADVQQDFLSHKWSAQIPFLHVPQVVVLEKGFENEAVINGVAQQMELTVLLDVKAPIDSDSEEKPLVEAVGEDFGFVKEGEIAESEIGSQKTEDGEPRFAEALRGESVEDGLINEKDIKESLENENNAGVEGFTNLKSVSKQPDLDIAYFKENEEKIEEEEFAQGKNKFTLPIDLAVVTTLLKKIKLPSSLKLPQGAGSGRKPVVILIGLIIFILVFSFLYYNFILSADISVFSDRKSVDKTATINFSKDSSSDTTIKLGIISEEIKGSEDKNATGKKETGDKSKGSVVIYNKTESPKTFNKGATVVGPNSLEFILTDDIKIASTSSFATSLSSSSVKIEAAKFGKEYNLPSGSNFTLKGFSTSDFIAKNSDATGGGSSKITTVVSKKDLADLLSLITQKLSGDAISKAQSEVKGDEAILQNVLATSVKDQSYSKKEGQETSSVGLSATIVYDIGKYNQNDINKVVKNISKGDVPATFVLEQSNSKVSIENVKVGKDGESASASLKINAIYSPQIDTVTLASKLKGKQMSDADHMLRGITGITDVNIIFRRKLPLLPNLLPFSSKNIHVEIKH